MQTKNLPWTAICFPHPNCSVRFDLLSDTQSNFIIELLLNFLMSVHWDGCWSMNNLGIASGLILIPIGGSEILGNGWCRHWLKVDGAYQFRINSFIVMLFSWIVANATLFGRFCSNVRFGQLQLCFVICNRLILHKFRGFWWRVSHFEIGLAAPIYERHRDMIFNCSMSLRLNKNRLKNINYFCCFDVAVVIINTSEANKYSTKNINGPTVCSKHLLFNGTEIRLRKSTMWENLQAHQTRLYSCVGNDLNSW